MKKISVFLLATFLLTGPDLIAQQFRRLTLRDAIEIAKQQSPDALNAKQAFRSSYWEYRSFKATNLPALSLDATIPEFSRAFTTYLGSDGIEKYVPQQKLSSSANLGLTQQIGVTGGTLFLNSGLQGMTYITDTTALMDNASYLSTPVSIGLIQPLFKYNAYRWDRKIQPLRYNQAKQKYLEDIEQISITATNYFFNLLQAQIDKKIAELNLSNYDTLFRISKGRYELGKIAENELLQFELSLLRAQSAMETAIIDLDYALFRFKTYLRIKDTIPVELIPPAEIDFFVVSPIEAISLAKSNSSAFLDFQRRLLEAKSEVNRAKMTGRFDADVTAIFGLTQTANTVPDAYRNPLDQQQVSLGLTIPIYDWGVARGRIKIVEAQQEIVNNNVEQEMIDFERSIYLKVAQFNMQKTQVTIAAKSDTVARKNYEVSKGRYLIGKPISAIELIQAQTNTDESLKGYYGALMTYWRSYFDLRKTTLYDFKKKEPLKFNISLIDL